MKEQIPGSLTLEEVLLNKKYTVNYSQREYQWGRKQIEQLVNDLLETFSGSYEVIPEKEKNEFSVVEKMEFYYMAPSS